MTIKGLRLTANLELAQTGAWVAEMAEESGVWSLTLLEVKFC